MSNPLKKNAPIILWLRNDLRLDDHAPLAAAIGRGGGAPLAPVYCLDPRHFEETALGHGRTGAIRARFLLETLVDLKRRLRGIGSDLFVRLGRPEDVLPALAERIGAGAMYYHYEAEWRAVRVEQRVTDRMREAGVSAHGFWGATLHHIADLPYSVSNVPSSFKNFRRDIEHRSFVREPIEAPQACPSPPCGLDAGAVPSLDDLWISNPERDPRAMMVMRGGEGPALTRLAEYIWEEDGLQTFKATRHKLSSVNDASRLSPWLAIGALSPRRVWAEVRRYEKLRGASDSTYWMIFELRLRDYFRFLTLRHAARLYDQGGVQQQVRAWSQEEDVFARWCRGETGVPFVDAIMRELSATGYINGRCRQAAASFLTQTLGIDWRWGASYFASQLIDYDPCSNWMNWQQIAGVGPQTRHPFYNVTAHGRRLDPAGDYIRRWLPALRAVPAPHIHELNTLPPQQLADLFGVSLGADYPEPINSTRRVYQAILPLMSAMS